MSVLKRLWIQIVHLAKALEGIDDPAGNYMFVLGQRVDKLERDVARLESELPRPAGSGSSSKQ